MITILQMFAVVYIRLFDKNEQGQFRDWDIHYSRAREKERRSEIFALQHHDLPQVSQGHEGYSGPEQGSFEGRPWVQSSVWQDCRSCVICGSAGIRKTFCIFVICHICLHIDTVIRILPSGFSIWNFVLKGTMERGRHGDGLGATMGSHGHGRMAGKAGEFFFLNNCSLPHRLTTDFYQNKQSSCIKAAPFLPFSGGSVAFAPPSRMSPSAAAAPHVHSPIPVKSALAKLGTDLAPLPEICENPRKFKRSAKDLCTFAGWCWRATAPCGHDRWVLHVQVQDP